jgi:hypothetical protein
MRPLQEQYDEIIATLPPDWSTMTLRLTLRDANQSEECALVLSPLNPWHEGDWRSGVFRFRVSRTSGYGAAHPLARRKMGTLDELGIGGDLERMRALSDVLPVATQGPLL